MRVWLAGIPALRTQQSLACVLLRPFPARRASSIMQVLSSMENMQAAVGSPPTKAQRLTTAEPAMQPRFVKMLSADASAPRRGSAGAAGYDLARYVCRGDIFDFIRFTSLLCWMAAAASELQGHQRADTDCRH